MQKRPPPANNQTRYVRTLPNESSSNHTKFLKIQLTQSLV